jgi:hypothetical protein
VQSEGFESPKVSDHQQCILHSSTGLNHSSFLDRNMFLRAI